MQILRDAEKCYSCKVCELMCSFHHGGVFSPELSSINVTKNNRTGKITWCIDSTCDSCESETRPLCIAHCSYGALKEVK